MLVIISDLHLTDGSTCETINAGAFRQFVHMLSSQAESACWRLKPGQTDGVFEPLERIDVVLLGDILDVIRSDHWLDTERRPWDSPERILSDVTAITRGILKHNDFALSCFRNLNGHLPITATHNQETHSIPIHFHYFVGNHDWFYHLKGPGWDALRSEIKLAMALDNDPQRVFPHLLEESEEVSDICQRHRVHLQHGDIFDAVNYQKDKGRDFSSLGDAIVIEILNGFPERVRRELALPIDHPLYLAFKEADNIRPILSLPNYFAMATNHFATRSQQKHIQELWTEASNPLLDLSFVRSLDKPWEFDTVDALQAMFTLQRNLPMMVQGQLAKLVEKFTQPESYRHQAAAEPDIKKGLADFVVYGHTHHAEMVPLSVREKDGVRREQIYINTGTWRRVHEQTQGLLNDFPFVHYHVMTYAFFYKDDERFGRRHESWQGTLG
jgi:UDP-2,3-diacylglucosamine pyrophosphatase LpxH